MSDVTPETDPAPAAGRPLRLLPGRLLPGTRYRLVRWLGEGAMGVVYEAEHVDLDRRVAIKILRPEHRLSPRIAQQFRDEARAASKIGSRYLVSVLEFGELSDGRLLYVMELLAGESLANEVERAPIDAARLIAILRQTCKGLHAAHQAGIVHRDVKPENVLLISRGKRKDAVKIVDFGVARIVARADETEHGLVGTPYYLAPEHCAGLPFDGRLDMYALGCAAYELVVGQPPFHGADTEEVVDGHLHRAPKPIREARPDARVPAALEAVIHRCLAKTPGERYVDMADLEAALCEAQIECGLRTAWDDLPLPEVEADRRRKLERRMPASRTRPIWVWPVVALASAGLAAVATLYLTRPPADLAEVDALTSEARAAAAQAFWVYPPQDDPRRATAYQKVLELEGVAGDAEDGADERAAALRDEFAQALVRIGDRLWSKAGGHAFAADYYTQALMFRDDDPRARERVGVPAALLTELSRKAANGDFTAYELDTAHTLALVAREDTSGLARKWSKGGGASPMLDGVLRGYLEQEGGLPAPPPRPAMTVATTDTIAVPPPPIPTLAVTERAPVGRKPAGSPPRGPGPGENVEPAASDPAQAAALVRRAEQALVSGGLREAENLFHQALAQEPRNAAALRGLGNVYFDRGSYQRAATFGEKAVEVAPKDAGARVHLGDAYYKLLRYKDAHAQYLRAQALGDPRAAERLERVDKRLGPPSAGPAKPGP